MTWQTWLLIGLFAVSAAAIAVVVLCVLVPVALWTWNSAHRFRRLQLTIIVGCIAYLAMFVGVPLYLIAKDSSDHPTAAPPTSEELRADIHSLMPQYSVEIRNTIPGPTYEGSTPLLRDKTVTSISLRLTKPPKIDERRIELNALAGELSVIFHCLACSDQRPKAQTIHVYADGHSDEVAFSFTPDSQSERPALILTIERAGQSIARVIVPSAIAMGEAHPTEAAGLWVTSAPLHLHSLANSQQSVDLRVDISSHDGLLEVTASVPGERLRSALQKRGWNEFSSGSAHVSIRTRLKLERVLHGLHTAEVALWNALRQPEYEPMATAIKILDQRNAYQTPSFRLTADQRAAMTDALAKYSTTLGDAIAFDHPAKADSLLKKFVRDVSALARAGAVNGIPIRIQFRNTTGHTIYWRLVNIESLGHAGSQDMQDFLGLSAEVSEDDPAICEIRPLFSNQGSSFDLILARWKRPDDHLSQRVDDLVTGALGSGGDFVTDRGEYGYDAIEVRSTLDFVSALRVEMARTRPVGVLVLGQGPIRRAHESSISINFGDPSFGLSVAEIRSLGANTEKAFALSLVMLATFSAQPDSLTDSSFGEEFLGIGASSVVEPVSEMWGPYAVAFTRDLAGELSEGRQIQSALRNVTLKHLRDRHNPAGLLFALRGEATESVLQD